MFRADGHTDGRTDGHTGRHYKLTATFHNFANMPKKDIKYTYSSEFMPTNYQNYTTSGDWETIFC